MNILNDECRRAVELMLVGYMLDKDNRTEILDLLPAEMFSDMTKQMVTALRDQDKNLLVTFLGDIGVSVTEGRSIPQALASTIANDNDQTKVRDICRSLSYASRIESSDELKKRLKRCLDVLETVSNTKVKLDG